MVDEAHCISEWGHDFRSSGVRKFQSGTGKLTSVDIEKVAASRRGLLLRYFGDIFESPCRNCGRCAEALAKGTGAKGTKNMPLDATVGTRREVA